MKNIKRSAGVVMLSLALFAGACASSKNPARIEKMRTIVEAKNFDFRPNSILPLPSTGRRLELTTGRYNVSLINGTLRAELPFIGQSIAPTIDRDEEMIRFTTTDFTYDTKNIRKNHWQVTIRPRGVQHVDDLIFDIYDNGSTTLKVSSGTRQSMSFEGFIVASN